MTISPVRVTNSDENVCFSPTTLVKANALSTLANVESRDAALSSFKDPLYKYPKELESEAMIVLAAPEMTLRLFKFYESSDEVLVTRASASLSNDCTVLV